MSEPVTVTGPASPPAPLAAAGSTTGARTAPATWPVVLGTVAAVGMTVAALVMSSPEAFTIVAAVLVGLWTAAGLALHRRGERLGRVVILGAVVGAAGLLAGVVITDQPDSWAAALGLRLAMALLPAVAFHLLLSLPGRGRLSASRRRAVATGYAVAVAAGAALMFDRDDVAVLPLFCLWLAALVGGLYVANTAYRSAGAVDRRRMQWIGWALAVCAEVVLVAAALNLLASWPERVGLIAFAVTGLVPLAIIAGTVGRLVMRVDRLLTYTVSLAGLTTLVVAVYLLVVIGLGRRPEGDERSLLLLSMVAAGMAALLHVPARHWLAERANRLVYGERIAPDETLRTFGQRLSRAIPLDELLLQLAESLRKSLPLDGGRGVDRAGRALRAGRRRAASRAAAVADRGQGAGGRGPGRGVRWDVDRHLAARAGSGDRRDRDRPGRQRPCASPRSPTRASCSA